MTKPPTTGSSVKPPPPYRAVLVVDKAGNNLTGLRDRFAAAAMAGILADPKVKDSPANLAAAAYRVADAMLKARGK